MSTFWRGLPHGVLSTEEISKRDCGHPDREPGSSKCPRWREEGMCCVSCTWFLPWDQVKAMRESRLAKLSSFERCQRKLKYTLTKLQDERFRNIGGDDGQSEGD
ncbi:MAG: hypothetical protein AMS21_00960 [Gemmatimonas sp. SG8_38_2]|nr:MAG: hypothetical protein AMS21_00960 [Gemmatimonas sp. SG8_38_2]